MKVFKAYQYYFEKGAISNGLTNKCLLDHKYFMIIYFCDLENLVIDYKLKDSGLFLWLDALVKNYFLRKEDINYYFDVVKNRSFKLRTIKIFNLTSEKILEISKILSESSLNKNFIFNTNPFVEGEYQTLIIDVAKPEINISVANLIGKKII